MVNALLAWVLVCCPPARMHHVGKKQSLLIKNAVGLDPDSMMIWVPMLLSHALPPWGPCDAAHQWLAPYA